MELGGVNAHRAPRRVDPLALVLLDLLLDVRDLLLQLLDLPGVAAQVDPLKPNFETRISHLTFKGAAPQGLGFRVLGPRMPASRALSQALSSYG
jgi:hypothetical protein